MLANVIGSYLDSLEEREFDAPFIALLRALGFRDIHLLHGAFEFGKDFIAKGTHNGELCQFAFQTKAGDIGLSDWNGCRGQIDMLRTNSLAHPGFDQALPRQAVFVTTGRLVGAAALAAQEYGKHLQQLGESGFLVWDKEVLVDLISANPEIGIGGNLEGALLALLGHIDQNRIQEIEIESFSRRWFSNESSFPLYRAALEAAVLGNSLRRHERLDLACFAALCLVRASWTYTHGIEPPDALATVVADTGRALFVHYASDLFGRCADNAVDPLALIQAHEPLAAHVTYPVRCMRLVEIIGLLGLLEQEGESEKRKAIVGFLVRFFQANPGASHPISDHWAVSLIPPVLLLATAGYREQVRGILESVIRWICDRYEGDNFGLAEAHSTPEEEVAYLLGSPFEHVTLQRRRASYIATVVLDLAAMMEMNELFELAIHDFLAVHAMPPVIEVSDTPGQYVLTAEDIRFEPNMQYSTTWAPVDGWKVAPHHKRGPADYYLERIGRLWDHLAVTAVLRDRHFLPTCRALLTAP
jgi:hypothetical protein